MTSGEAVMNDQHHPAWADDAEIRDLTVQDAYAALSSFAQGVHIERCQVAYISTPITTGRVFYERLRAIAPANTSSAHLAMLREEVMVENARSAGALLERVRAEGVAALCVDPTPLKVKGSSQGEYLTFWLNFIESHVGTVIMAPGWQYSSGSATECAAAISRRLRVLDSNFDGLSASSALSSIEDALEDLAETFGYSPDLLHAAGKRLRKLEL